MITVRVRDREANALPRWPITSGSVGLPCAFSFDEAWDGLSKIATFKGSGTAVDVALFSNNCVVPAEVLATAGGDLFIGVYGANGEGTRVTPTVWANAGYIYEGSEPSEVDPAEPTPSWAAQVQEAAESAMEAAEAAEAAAAAAAEHCIPAGGTRNQVLTKNSNVDFDASWKDPQGGGGGGGGYEPIFVSAVISKSDSTYSFTTAPDLSNIPIEDYYKIVIKATITNVDGGHLFYPVQVPTENNPVWFQLVCYESIPLIIVGTDLSVYHTWTNISWSVREEAVLLTNGANSMKSYINMASHKIINLAAGTNNTDAVNKKQLDDELETKIDAPASASDGDVLSYDDGEWVAGTVKGAFVINASVDQSFNVTADHTYSELVAAISAGKQLVLYLTSGSSKRAYTSYSIGNDRISFPTVESKVTPEGQGVTNIVSNAIRASSDGWALWVSQTQLTPLSIGAGTYSKPANGIPKTDLASAVQTSLGKADTALQTAVTSLNGQTGDVTLQVATDAQVQNAVDDYLDDHPTVTGTFTNEAKHALISLLEKVAYIDENGQTYLDTLEAELFAVSVTSIAAVFTQGGNVIYDTDSLDTLKQYLVVTATYSDSTTATVTAYTLSGTLTEGTSTITVSYGGKTDTFSVTVSIGLDSIAYGTKTYRDIFITGNLLPFGDFESTLNISSSWVNWNNNSNRKYKANAGSPVQSTTACNSPTKSLKCFGSSAQQLNYYDTTVHPTGEYICAVSISIPRYVSGNGSGVPGVYVASGNIIGENRIKRQTDGFEEQVTILDAGSSNTNTFSIFVGSTGDSDAYVDDVVFTPLPSGMTLAEAQTLYEKYCAIRRAS